MNNKEVMNTIIRLQGRLLPELNDWDKELFEACDKVLDLSEKNTPIKPIGFEDFEGESYEKDACPNCKCSVLYRLHDGEILHCGYCPNCGQAMDWSDVDE